MTLTSLIRNLESRLKKAEKLTRYYDSHAHAVRTKLTGVANALGRKVETTLGIRKTSPRKKRKISRAHRKAIAAAQRARWKKWKAGKKGK